MFTEFIPSDRPTAFLEIGIILLITFILGFICAKIPLGKKKALHTGGAPLEEPHFEERDIITEPTTIRATLTRERGGTLADKKAITSSDNDNSATHEEEE